MDAAGCRRSSGQGVSRITDRVDRGKQAPCHGPYRGTWLARAVHDATERRRRARSILDVIIARPFAPSQTVVDGPSALPSHVLPSFPKAEAWVLGGRATGLAGRQAGDRGCREARTGKSRSCVWGSYRASNGVPPSKRIRGRAVAGWWSSVTLSIGSVTLPGGRQTVLTASVGVLLAPGRAVPFGYTGHGD